MEPDCLSILDHLLCLLPHLQNGNDSAYFMVFED